MDQSRLKVCYVITQRGEKKYWNRVGVAFLNSDGSINVKLESLPVAGDFQIRDYVPREEKLVPSPVLKQTSCTASQPLAA